MAGIVNRALTTASALGAGMLMMYLFDPEQGRRRRALAGDRMRSASARVIDMADVASRDALNRGRGVVEDMRSRLLPAEVSAHTLEERVRARIGRAVSNAGAIEVRTREPGTIVLSGPVLKGELNALMSSVWSARGVEAVDNQLQIHEAPGNVPGLQGTREPEGGGRLPENWPPAVRMLAGGAGTLALVFHPLGWLGALAGGALLARSVGNKPLRELAGLGGPRSVHIDKEIFIDAPPEQVFAFWQRQENFPRFMRNVQEVRPAGDNRWHWRVSGPMGASVEWDSEIVERDEGRRLVWRTLAGSSVRHEGRVDFEPDEAGRTRLRVSMDYAPAAGVLGHTVARLFGKDAKTEMDEDLMRMKAFLETGTPARDAALPGGTGFAEQPRSLH